MKIKGTFVDQVSGSLAGITGSRNRGGQYLRRRANPVNPNSARQADVRSIFSGLVSSWLSTVTTAGRQAWTAYANNVPNTDSLGNTIVRTGQQMYIGCNTPRLQAGLARVDTGPVIFDTGENPVSITTFEVVSPTTINVVGNLSAPASDDGDLLLYIGPPQNVSRNFFKGPYQFAAAIPVAAAATTFTEATLEYLSSNVIAEGDWLPVRMRMAYDDGRLSTVYETFVTPVA